MDKLERWQLNQRQAQPLEIKEQLTLARIRAYYEHLNGQVYVLHVWFAPGKNR
jgi:hypothetical protein